MLIVQNVVLEAPNKGCCILLLKIFGSYDRHSISAVTRINGKQDTITPPSCMQLLLMTTWFCILIPYLYISF